MAFRKKAEFILAEQPDILIVPECENKERLDFGLFTVQPTDSYWNGDLPTKGIGIFTYGDFKIKLLDIHNPDFKYVIPLLIYNDKISLAVCAVWSQKPANSVDFPVQRSYSIDSNHQSRFRFTRLQFGIILFLKNSPFFINFLYLG